MKTILKITLLSTITIISNANGSQDTMNLDTGEMTLGFENSDGSQDTMNLDTGKMTLGFANSDDDWVNSFHSSNCGIPIGAKTTL